MLAIFESTKELRLLRGYWRATVVMRESEPPRRRRSQAGHAQFRIHICMLGTKSMRHLASRRLTDANTGANTGDFRIGQRADACMVIGEQWL
jgi:hypothetical protein